VKAQQSIDFNVNNFCLVGSAKVYSDGNYFQLTDGIGQNRKGAIWSNDKLDLSQPFIIHFTANFGDQIDLPAPPATPLYKYGADGVCFVLQLDNRAKTAIGGMGGAIGYGTYFPGEVNDPTSAISNSIAIEFDTWRNELEDEIDKYGDITSPKFRQDHISFLKNGSQYPDQTEKHELLRGGVGVDIEDGKPHCIKIEWVPGTLGPPEVAAQFIVWIDDLGPYIKLIDQEHLNSSFSSNMVYWGITSATGNYKNLHTISFDNNIFVRPVVTICYGDNIRLNTIAFKQNGTSSPTFEWFPTTGLSDPNIQSPIASPLTTTEYIVKMKIDGNVATGKVKVNVNGKAEESSLKLYKKHKFNVVGYSDIQVMSILKTAECGYLLCSQPIASDYNEQNKSYYCLINLVKTDCNGEKIMQTMLSRDENQNGLHHSCVSSVCNLFLKNNFAYERPFCMTSENDFSFEDLKENIGYLLTGESSNPLAASYNRDMYVMNISTDLNVKSSMVFGFNEQDRGEFVLQSKDGTIAATGLSKLYSSGAPNYNSTRKLLFTKLKLVDESGVSKLYTHEYMTKHTDWIEAGDCRIYSSSSYGIEGNFLSEAYNFYGDLVSYLVVGNANNGIGNDKTLVLKLNNVSDLPIEWAYIYTDGTNILSPVSVLRDSDGTGYFILANGLYPTIFKIDVDGNVIQGLSKRITNSSYINFTNYSLTETNDNNLCILLQGTNSRFPEETITYKIDKALSNAVLTYSLGSTDLNNDGYTDPLKPQSITKTNPTGFASLMESVSTPNNQTRNMLLSISNLNENICESISTANILNPVAIVRSEDIKNTISVSGLTKIEHTFSPKLPDNQSTTLCSTKTCYCENDHIKVDIRHKETIEPGDEGKCCYIISFNSLPNACHVSKLRIFLNGNTYDINDFQLSPDGYKEIKFCVNEFSSSSTIMFQYLTNSGEIICSDTKNISCYCSCGNFDKNSINVYLTPTNEPPDDECCYYLTLGSDLPCAMKFDGIEMSVSEEVYANLNNTNFLAFDNWSESVTGPNNGFYKIMWAPPQNKKITKFELPLYFGKICVSGVYDVSRDISFKIKNGNSYCPLVWNYDLNCERNCCDVFDNLITEYRILQHQDDPCCFDIEFWNNRALSNIFCELDSVILTFPDNVRLSFSEATYLDPEDDRWKIGGEPGNKNQILNICADPGKVTNKNPFEVTVQFKGKNGKILCDKKQIFNIDDCFSDCCSDLEVDCQRIDDGNGNCSYHFNVRYLESSHNCDIYGFDIIDESNHSAISEWVVRCTESYPFELKKINYLLSGTGYNISVPCAGYNIGDLIRINLYNKDLKVICSKTISLCGLGREIANPTETFENENVIISDLMCKPNPISDYAVLSFYSNKSNYVTIVLADIFGRKISTLSNGKCRSGNNSLPVQTNNLSSGIYYIRLRSGEIVKVIPIIILN